MRAFILSLFIPCLSLGQGPYAPPAGQAGTTAISKDSSIFEAWAVGCSLQRGYYDIANKDSTVTHGSSNDAIGPADGNVVSLGDSGTATITFAEPIHNGPGADFAVFENSFTDDYLELAFVEVSSDGSTFVRFPAVSLTPTATQTGSFGPTDARNLYNLAGKYRGGYGTPFDLADLQDSAIDINHITHVRIVDVVGSVDPLLGSYDSQGNLVNDPYPTVFASGGFDLDAVGVIHSGELGLAETEQNFKLYPNPAGDFLIIEDPRAACTAVLTDSHGRPVLTQEVRAGQKLRLDISLLPRGAYLLTIKNGKEKSTQKILVE